MNRFEKGSLGHSQIGTTRLSLATRRSRRDTPAKAWGCRLSLRVWSLWSLVSVLRAFEM